MKIKLLHGALKRKKKPQVVLRTDTEFGFKLIDADKARDKHYYSIDFLGVFTGKTTRNVLEREDSY